MSEQKRFVDALETEAIEQLQVIRDFRSSAAGDNDSRGRAKLAIGVIGAYVRLRATMANERSNDLIERRLLTIPGAGGVAAALPE